MSEKHKPNDDRRKQVKAMSGYGITQEDIATVLGIDSKTLRLYYAEELAKGAPEANAAVAQSLFQMATKGKNVAAAIWWTKTRMGWKETVRVDGTGEGGAIIFQILTGVPRNDTPED
jgi:hypothetical protein